MGKKKNALMLISVISMVIFMCVCIMQTAQRKLGSGQSEYALITSSVYESEQSEQKNRYSYPCPWLTILF